MIGTAPEARVLVLARARARLRPWTLVFAAAALFLAVLRLAALGTSPPGLYLDEASVGYNGFSISRSGTDEHGVHFPLFFAAFGEYKGPVAIYMVAAFTKLLPLTPYVVRLPSALCGLATVLFVALIAWRLTRSRPVTLLALLSAGLMPWLFLDSRTDMEAIVPMVLLLVVAVWCLVHVDGSRPARWFAGAGAALGIALFAYTPARLGMALIAGLVVLCYGLLTRRHPSWWAVLPPVIAAYAVLLQWSLRHPGALLARYNALSITADHPALPTAIGRFVNNYVQYFGFPFLFTHGDANLRHSTGYGGLLFVTTLPALVAGIVVCLRRWREPLSRFALGGLVLGPIPAALTADGTPHSLRASLMLPFVLLLMVLGWQTIWPFLSCRRLWLLALAAAVCVEAGGYFNDFFVEYPARALARFDTGRADAIARAHQLAAGRPVLLSSRLEGAYIEALFSVRPDPAGYVQHGLSVVNMSVVDPRLMEVSSGPGDVLVLDPSDTPPAGATLIFEESVTVTRHTAQAGAPDQQKVPLVEVYRR